MKRTVIIRNIAMLLVACAPLAYLAIIWNKIPNEVLYFKKTLLEIDQRGDRIELLWGAVIIAAISYLLYLLLHNIHIFDPKRKTKAGNIVFNKLGIGSLVLLAVMNCIMISSALEGEVLITRFFYPLIGLTFAFLGNFMHSVKPNYFVGLRLPWTLSNDENWRKTHQLAGKLWFWGGLLYALISLIFPPGREAMYINTALLLILVIIPVVYSFRLFKAFKKTSY